MLIIKKKKIPSNEKKIPTDIFKKLTILSESESNHIIQFNPHDVFLDEKPESSTQSEKVILSYVYEYGICDIRNLIQYFFKQNKSIPLIAIKSIIFQLLLALDYLHSRNIIHGNVVPANIFIMSSSSPTPGIVKLNISHVSHIIGKQPISLVAKIDSIWYASPEMILGDPYYDFEVDIWATGCIFAELFTGNALFQTSHSKGKDINDFDSKQLLKIMSILGPISDQDLVHPQQAKYWKSISHNFSNFNITLDSIVPISSLGLDLLKKMFIYNPKKRITAKEALRHPFFNEFPIAGSNLFFMISKEDWTQLEQQGKNVNQF